MRIITILILMLFISCKDNKSTISIENEQLGNKNILIPEFQSIIDSSNVVGSILIYDLDKDLYYSNDFEWSNKSNLPASTFKIANSIIGLETGVIESDTAIFKWDGEKKWLKEWEQDLLLKDAFQYSCVPCYQEVARKIGVKRMNEYVQKLNYGDLKIDSVNIDNFWLKGESRISQMQQIDFLKRFYNSELPISERTEKNVKKIMVMEETDQYKLSGKTGLSTDEGKYNGWFVGYLELKNKTYLFATNFEPKKAFDLDAFIKKRIDLTRLAFQNLNILK
ncbi:class D beta-lactamase [Formosa sediminum]|uniref:Beta-lactamase n=1 Tax=Formosa sediminum TaxID=2594004 RepID=A0A516GUV6_9FLAO|nr:class D beta-lactamase [Formosa sediminum]QDO95286.1 class D beta-lactamase [Formosa sediminum]